MNLPPLSMQLAHYVFDISAISFRLQTQHVLQISNHPVSSALSPRKNNRVSIAPSTPCLPTTFTLWTGFKKISYLFQIVTQLSGFRTRRARRGVAMFVPLVCLFPLALFLSSPFLFSFSAGFFLRHSRKQTFFFLGGGSSSAVWVVLLGVPEGSEGAGLV